MKLNLFTDFSETKSPARLPVSRRASTRVLTLVCFEKEENVTERRLESITGEDGDKEYINSRLSSFSCLQNASYEELLLSPEGFPESSLRDRDEAFSASLLHQ